MRSTSTGVVTRLLRAWSAGDLQAEEELLPLVYNELRRRAANHLRRDRRDHTLQPTAVVHEAYLRLLGQRGVDWQSRAHFFALASRMMRSHPRGSTLARSPSSVTRSAGSGRFAAARVRAWSTRIRALPLFGDRKPFAITQTPFMEYDGRFSPDGRWIAYRSDETGHNEIHIRPFPGPGTPVQVSVGGGTTPRWRRDGREMFYVAPDRRLMAVSVIERGQTIERGAPRPLFTISTTSAYEPSPDGERFLVTAVVSDPSPITVILNWKSAAR